MEHKINSEVIVENFSDLVKEVSIFRRLDPKKKIV